MKNVRTTHFSFVFYKFFSLWREQFLGSVGDREAMQTKVTVEKTPKRAGATPLFRLSAAQKVFGVAPALRHGESCRLFFPRCQEVRKKHTSTEEEHHADR